MNRKMSLLWYLAVLTLFALSSCAAKGTQITSVYSDKDYQGGKVRKVFVIGVSKKPKVRKMFEDEFVKQLRSQGADGVASYTVLPTDKMQDKETILDKIHGVNADSCIITKLISREDALKDVPPEHRDINSYYVRSYNYTYNRGYILQDEAVSLETNLYDVKTEKLIWSALSENFKRGTDEERIKEFIGKMTDNLKKKNYL